MTQSRSAGRWSVCRPRAAALLVVAVFLLTELAAAAPALANVGDPTERPGFATAGDKPMVVARRRRRRRRPTRKKRKRKPDTSQQDDGASSDDSGNSGAPASGGGAAPASPAASPDAAALRRGARVEFDGRLVQGQTAKSGAIYLFARKRSDLRSMVKERKDYRKEILRTVYPDYN